MITIEGGAGRPSRSAGPAAHGRRGRARRCPTPRRSCRPRCRAASRRRRRRGRNRISPSAPAPVWRAHSVAGQRRPVGPVEVVGLEIEEVVPVRVGLQQVDGHGLTRPCGRYFRQNASRCHPKRRTSRPRDGVECPDEEVVVARRPSSRRAGGTSPGKRS
ncbi:MAG: hypothetical protein MZV64_73535 [Ignavibacteriales bacterium]|nr:hypothetical protein [Ignavibacteriales bacterium]